MRSRATLTIAEVALLLGVHTNTVYRAVETGEFPVPVIRIGRKMLFSAQAVERLLSGDVGASGF